MKSLTKNMITHEEIKELVRVHFGDKVSILSVHEHGGGMFNAAYILALENVPEDVDSELVLKVAVSPDAELLTYEKDIMRTEVAVNYRLAEKGGPVPRIVKTDFSRQHINSDYFFMKKLEGATWHELDNDLTHEEKEMLKEELGELFCHHPFGDI